MFLITDGKRTVGLSMWIWDGKNCSEELADVVMEMTVPRDPETGAHIVPDVQYCIDYAYDWRDFTGDFYNDRFDCGTGEEIITTDERLVYVEEQ